jgi:hypothetical protein
MESKARLTMREISFEQTQSSTTDQQRQRDLKGFRKHLSLGIMSFYKKKCKTKPQRVLDLKLNWALDP